jgi:hypothetical protein
MSIIKIISFIVNQKYLHQCFKYLHQCFKYLNNYFNFFNFI